MLSFSFTSISPMFLNFDSWFYTCINLGIEIVRIACTYFFLWKDINRVAVIHHILLYNLNRVRCSPWLCHFCSYLRSSLWSPSLRQAWTRRSKTWSKQIFSRCSDSFLILQFRATSIQRTKKNLQAILKNIGLISLFCCISLNVCVFLWVDVILTLVSYESWD